MLCTLQAPLSLSARRAWIEIDVSERESLAEEVALRKESVDRNSVAFVFGFGAKLSLSARRAWIEIRKGAGRKLRPLVALRKESVDRNDHLLTGCYTNVASLSARRAWIEISAICCLAVVSLTSLSARRAWIEIAKCWSKLYCGRRRSPQGERG